MKPRVIKVRSENNHFQHVEVLKRNRAKRQRYGEFFVEGVTPLNRAIEHGWEMQTLVYSTEKRLSKWAREVIDRSTAEMHLDLSPALMDKLSDKEDHSELLAVFKMAPDDLSRIEVTRDLLVVAFDRPSNHGNLGTAIRSCDAFGVGGLIVTGHAVDLYDTRTIRASVGSVFAVPVVRLPSHSELAVWLETLRSEFAVQVVGTSAKAKQDILDADLSRPTLLAIGNETIGLSRSYRDLCDEMYRIPMYGSTTSLNVACAASILLYEADRQRRTLTDSRPVV
jgi:tRNA G18 (ribose-2'-O)-methylase SpoU